MWDGRLDALYDRDHAPSAPFIGVVAALYGRTTPTSKEHDSVLNGAPGRTVDTRCDYNERIKHSEWMSYSTKSMETMSCFNSVSRLLRENTTRC